MSIVSSYTDYLKNKTCYDDYGDLVANLLRSNDPEAVLCYLGIDLLSLTRVIGEVLMRLDILEDVNPQKEQPKVKKGSKKHG